MSAHKGDVGTLIKIDVQTDLSEMITLKIIFNRPDKTIGFWPAFIIEPTVMGYLFAPGDLNQAGIWSVQPYAESADSMAYGDVINFTVEKNLS